MKQLFEIETDKSEILDKFRELARKYSVNFREWELANTDNPSPSGDPFFANPENVKEIVRRRDEMEKGVIESVPLTDDIMKQLLDNA